MLCPRCQLLMGEDQYEGHTVQFCGNCWGHWVETRTLDSILRTDHYTFSEAERRVILESWANRGKQNTVQLIGETIHCPSCSVELERKRFLEDCPVIVDMCPEHGVWLDTGEIKELQIFFERSGQGE